MNASDVALSLPRGLRLPPRRSAFWLAAVPVAALALAGVVLWLTGVPGGDDPAHLYKITLLREGQSIVWDNYWYGGSYGAITYGVVYYWLAQWAPAILLIALSGGLLPLFLHLYLRDVWGVGSRAPAWSLAGILVVYLAWGQSPFLFALCLTMAGLVLLGRGHPLFAAMPLAVAVFTNPLALIAGGVFVLGDLIAHRAARRAVLILGLAMLPVVGLRAALAAVFSAPSWEFHVPAELIGLLTFVALGVLLARSSSVPSRRALQWVFVAFALVIVPAYLIPGMPVGSNAGRFYYVFGAPLLIAAAWPTRLPRWAPVLALVVTLAFQLAFPLWLLARFQHLPATRAEFFAPALSLAGRLYDPGYRFHIVTPERHWEAYYFPAAGYAITRGWFRQADALHNAELYDAALSEASYASWLRRVGARHVFLPHAPLVSGVQREARILQDSRDFTVIYRGTLWTVYELRDGEPMVSSLSPRGAAQVLTLDHTTARFTVSRAGLYRVKLTWSPYWLLARRPDEWALRGRDQLRLRGWEADATPVDRTVLRRDDDGFMLFSAPSPGLYTLRFDAAGAAEAELLE